MLKQTPCSLCKHKKELSEERRIRLFCRKVNILAMQWQNNFPSWSLGYDVIFLTWESEQNQQEHLSLELEPSMKLHTPSSVNTHVHASVSHSESSASRSRTCGSDCEVKLPSLLHQTSPLMSAKLSHALKQTSCTSKAFLEEEKKRNNLIGIDYFFLCEHSSLLHTG